MPQINSLPRIKRLASALANQIAAGEVIERPASVVKELLENCLDAGATRIFIDVGKAGSGLIRVSDNGHGIHPEDLQLALERHATAKLRRTSDLAAIHSLGFRGEALPSIASVAALTLTSRIATREQGAQLVADPPGSDAEFKPAAHPVGTTVEVRNLFHNTPARRKFLRSQRTEFLHIQEMVRRLALSRADVTIELRHNRQKILSCRAVAGDPGSRVAGLLGRAFMRKAIALDYRAAAMHVWGWLGVGELARSTRDRQYLYLNGRVIRDQRLNHAIRLASTGRVDSGRFLSYVLYLELDAAAADVNVHPAKHEVRFLQPRDVHDFLYAAVSTALAGEPDPSAIAASEPGSSDEYAPSVTGSLQHRRPGKDLAETIAGYAALAARRRAEPVSATPVAAEVLLQIQPGYMLLQRGAEVLLFNIKAAKKHIALSRLQSISSATGLRSRPLLVPVSFAIDRRQENVLACIGPLLEEFAMQLELNGPGSCSVRMIPALLADADIAALVEDILRLKLADSSSVAIREALIAILVRHVADIPDPAMSRDNMADLLRQLELCGLDISLPRHAPIWRVLSTADLDSLLKGDVCS